MAGNNLNRKNTSDTECITSPEAFKSKYLTHMKATPPVATLLLSKHFNQMQITQHFSALSL